MAISGSDGSIILTTKVDQTGLKKGLGSIKKLGATAGKAFLAIGAAAATATVAITKMAVSAYADYEQLVGGVETLFKGSAQKVIDYANDAFYTAGVSANEYMQQVTSFSASLIRSTAGDTDKAADIANMALIDISDNVNKMGSSMESVTLAYQGFAKQQYMLLDNLKLGYGGTKTEMERLLKDAQALTGVKYDINNLADVYSAIHAVQEELGITGTTAKEAEKTITGSANMMKAAWQNVLSAISGGGDLDRAINNLVYSIQKYFENIVPVVQRSLVGIGRLIEQVAPMLVQNVASALIQSIPSLINAVYQMIIGLAKGIWQGIKALFTGGSGSVTADIKTSVGGVSSSLDSATDSMNGLGDATDAAGKSAKGAGKEAKKSLAAFDDLNIISENSSAGGGGGGGAGGISGGIGGAGDVSSEMSIVPEDDTQITFLDEILGKLQPIKEIFMSGFWQGFQNADFSGIEQSISGIKESLIGIYTSPEVQTAAQGFVSSVVLAFGQITGSIASIGTTIATNLLGGFNQYLQTNAPFIQTSIAKVYDASSGIATSIGNMWTAFANIFSAYASTNGQTLTANIIGIFANAVYGVTTLITQFANDFIKFLTQPIIDNQEGLKTVLDGLLGFFAEMFGGIKTLLDTLVQNVLALYEERISPFIQMLTDIVSEWVAKFVEAYEVYIQPVLEQFAQKFQEVVEQYLAPMFEKIFEFIGKTVDLVMPLWDGVLKPLVSWLIDVFANTFSEVFGRIGDIVTDAFKLVSGLISGIMDILGGIIDFIVGVFSGDWKRAWEGLVGIFKGIINVIISIFEGMINLIINAVNLFVSALDVVVSGVGDLIGKDWNIPKIPTVSIPRLAKGAVIPPNREFLAVLGDQKQGTNIEAPLQTIVDAFNIALAQNGGAGGKNTEVILEVDGREFGRAVVEQGNRENRRIGTRLVTV